MATVNPPPIATERDFAAPVSGRVDPVNTHDVLTGSDPQGMYSTAGGDTTCGNWTKSGDDGSAIVGHHDRMGLKVSRHMMSWNSSHGTRGCSPEGLKSTGGAGLFYCFLAELGAQALTGRQEVPPGAALARPIHSHIAGDEAVVASSIVSSAKVCFLATLRKYADWVLFRHSGARVAAWSGARGRAVLRASSSRPHPVVEGWSRPLID
jgi:hypothetical protein